MFLTIGTPYNGNCTFKYWESLIDVMLNRTFEVQLILQSGIYIHQNRNFIWYQTQGEYLLFIDADMEFKKEDIDKLIGLDKPIACGLYLNRHNAGQEPLVYDLTAKGFKEKKIIKLGPQEIDGTGCGFMLIKKEVIDLYNEGATEPPFDHVAESFAGKDGKPNVFTRQTWGEDLSFCWRMKQLGVPIWLHPGVKLGHVKSVVI